MKILQLIQKPQLRGAEVFASQLSNHINEAGHEAIICPLFAGSAQLPFEGRIIHLNGEPAKKYWDLKAWKKLAQIIKTEKPDLIQANAGDTLKYAIFSKVLFGWKQPVVFRNASTISLYIKSGFVKKLYQFLFRKTAKIISVSQASAADFQQLFPECRSRITVVPIGIESNSGAEAKTFENPFGPFVAAGGPVLLHVGGFSFEKNHKGLIHIFKDVLAKEPQATLHLLGDGPLRKEIEAFVAEQGLAQKVFFHGFQKHPLQWIPFADVLLLPSIIEGLPGVLLESFYCQTPVVAYDTGGIKEIVIPNETGCLVPKGEEALFAQAIMQTLQDKVKTGYRIENAFNLVNQKYLNTAITKQFIAIYKEQVSPKHLLTRETVTAY